MNEDELCPACEGRCVIYWPVYENPSFSESFFGGFVPRQIGEKPDDKPCPMCEGSGLDPYRKK